MRVRIPTKNESSKSGGYLPENRWQEKRCNSGDILNVLVELEEFAPHTPSFLILLGKLIPIVDKHKFNEICPIGLIQEGDFDLIDLEGMCDAYKMAPFSPPSLDGQPPVLLDIFKTIRSEKNKYIATKMEDSRKDKK